eukprot:scaffold8120_cov178-Ochromonas_danica.AAC.2
MSVIWQLPGDILHSVYSEWLGWKDVSRLDVACVGKSDREVWLTSLTDLRIFNAVGIDEVSDVELRLLYIWLKSRRVFCVEDFPVSVNVLEDLMVGGLDMESYCPALRSITIRKWSGIKINPDVDEVKDNLSDFLSHCHSLQGVTITMNYDDDIYFNVVLEVLVEKLRENSLMKLSLSHSLKLHESQVKMATLLSKHASSLRDLKLRAMIIDVLFSSLIMNDIHLRVLDVHILYVISRMTASLISYLSSAGDLLESLKVGWGWGLSSVDDFVVSVATLLPKLARLEFADRATCNMENVRLLYEQCPYLQDVSIYEAIQTNYDSRSVSILVRGFNDDWAVCLSHALRRRHYKEVQLRLKEDYYYPVENLKSLLEPYEIRLDVDTSNDSLISLLHDLPHLNSLNLMPFHDNQDSEAAFAAITEHANRLTGLVMTEYSWDVIDFPRFDQLLGGLIETCQLLTNLGMSYCGLESLVAISRHSSLRDVNARMDKRVSEEMLDGLLLDDKVPWPSTLEEGTVESDYGEHSAVFFRGSLYLSRFVDKHRTDATLKVFIKHAKSLTQLFMKEQLIVYEGTRHSVVFEPVW